MSFLDFRAPQFIQSLKNIRRKFHTNLTSSCLDFLLLMIGENSHFDGQDTHTNFETEFFLIFCHFSIFHSYSQRCLYRHLILKAEKQNLDLVSLSTSQLRLTQKNNLLVVLQNHFCKKWYQTLFLPKSTFHIPHRYNY